MTDAGGRATAWRALTATIASPAFARAYSLTAIGVVVASVALTRTMGEAGYLAMLGGLAVLGGWMLVARRDARGVGIVPFTLVAFVGWAAISALWSTNPARTIGGTIALCVVAFTAVVVAQLRDTLQTIRAFADVLRAALALSLALEVLSGVLIDMPITFLGIEGNLAAGGPLQGIFGTRNLLGFIAVIAIVTFAVEARLGAVPRGLSIGSIALAAGLAVFSASPTVVVLGAATLAASALLVVLRRVPVRRRRPALTAIAAVIALLSAAAFAFRQPIVAALGRGDDFATRAGLWDVVLLYSRVRAVQGWGWFGGWPDADTMPFSSIRALSGAPHRSALNSFLDVQLQLGLAGLALFAAMCGLALWRGWAVAIGRRSALVAWVPLILTVVLVNSVFESTTLWGASWFVLVTCVTRAGRTRSWRERVAPAPERLS